MNITPKLYGKASPPWVASTERNQETGQDSRRGAGQITQSEEGAAPLQRNNLSYYRHEGIARKAGGEGISDVENEEEGEQQGWVARADDEGREDYQAQADDAHHSRREIRSLLEWEPVQAMGDQELGEEPAAVVDCGQQPDEEIGSA